MEISNCSDEQSTKKSEYENNASEMDESYYESKTEEEVFDSDDVFLPDNKKCSDFESETERQCDAEQRFATESEILTMTVVDGEQIWSIQQFLSEEGSSSSEPTKAQQAPSTSNEIRMESSTEYLHHHHHHHQHHKFIPPTFSRLPPDGDEFPNSCWSDEQHQQQQQSIKKLYRSELTLQKSSSTSSQDSSDLGSPPPLPTSEPPREDLVPFEELSATSITTTNTKVVRPSGPPPPLPSTVPPAIPPKKMAATRRCSFDDRKKLFENSASIVGTSPKVPGTNSMNNSMSNNINNSSMTFTPATSSKSGEEPSKKSVKDKIAMFSSRSSSSEDSADSSATAVAYPKSITNHVSSSLSKSTMNISNASSTGNGLSMSTENLLGIGPTATHSLGRKGSVDLNPSILHGTINSSPSANFNTKPAPFYGTLNNSGMNKVNPPPPPPGNSYGPAPSLYERSQSMIDVGLSSNGQISNNVNGASYQSPNSNNNQNYPSYKYNNTSNAIDNSINQTATTTASRPVSTLMEQRRKCITKLRGLVIPDVPNTTGDASGNPNATSASIADLPTIISKDAVILPPSQFNIGSNNSYVSKPPVYNNGVGNSQGKKSLSRTESLDRFASIGDNNSYNNRNNLLSAKINAQDQTDSESSLNGDYKFSNVLPKYSPAFKRRGLTAYQPSVTSQTQNAKTVTAPVSIANNGNRYKGDSGNYITPEPKSLESLTSPKSESSFEYSSSSSPISDKRQTLNEPHQPIMAKRNSFDTPVQQVVEVDVEHDKNSPNSEVSPAGNYSKAGKLEDSDNDSAVSSSRSSISHGLSPPNSPTPGESTAATPDPDNDVSSRDGQDKQDQDGSEDSANMDESWRVLKPTSIEAINRKNVLKSAKFSSGGGLGQPQQQQGDNGADDSSLSSSSNGKNRRSDDEEGSYADAETEDTESSCSELEVTKSRRRMIVAGRINLGQRRDSKADTEEDDEELESSEISAVNMEFTELTESPLQAIYDMEVKMAYINEVCDALNDRGRSELSSRYFSRRDSEATVIERPIEPKRKLSSDTVDNAGAERRARNRSSSGNESDFSSNVSIGSQQNNHRSLSREPSNNGLDADRWSMLEKKYSKSMTSVNMLGAKGEPQAPQYQQPTLTPATSVPKIVTSASEVVEKKIERIIEKTTNSDTLTKRVTNATIPRGRNDFKSIAEKWQLIEKSSDSKTQSGSSGVTKPVIPDKPVLSPQNSNGSTGSPGFRSRLTSPQPSSTPSSARSLSKSNSNELSLDDPAPQIRPTGSSRSSNMKSSLDAMDADRAWSEKRRSDGGAPSRTTERIIPMSSTKRSVSVNDIRKAFEKAEIAVSGYGREESSPTSESNKKDAAGGLALPAAHFRVSSFDSTTSEESSATTPAGLYGSSNSLVSSAPRDPYGSITSLASSTSLISPQELQQLIDEANQSLEEAGTPSHEVSVVILHREFAGGSLGITLAGGADYETKEITVHKVLTASIADRDGRIHRGDRILSINGKSTKGLTHREALNLLKSPRTEVVLVISRGRTVSNGFQTIEETSALDRAVEPLLNGNLVIENDDDTCYKWGPLKTAMLIKDGAGLGFSLEGGKGSIQGDKPLTVKKIFIGGPAEKSGDLKVGDLIVSIQSVNMSTKSRTEAWNFMKKLSDGDVKICVRSPLM